MSADRENFKNQIQAFYAMLTFIQDELTEEDTYVAQVASELGFVILGLEKVNWDLKAYFHNVANPNICSPAGHPYPEVLENNKPIRVLPDHWKETVGRKYQKLEEIMGDKAKTAQYVQSSYAKQKADIETEYAELKNKHEATAKRFDLF